MIEQSNDSPVPTKNATEPEPTIIDTRYSWDK